MVQSHLGRGALLWPLSDLFYTFCWSTSKIHKICFIKKLIALILTQPEETVLDCSLFYLEQLVTVTVCCLVTLKQTVFRTVSKKKQAHREMCKQSLLVSDVGVNVPVN